VRVTFVRHGESQSNATGHWQGHGDSPLSAHGREQAKRAALRLPASRFSRIVSSDLSRARDTARAVGVEPELDPGLREIDVGAWEGLARADVLEKFPEQIAALVRGDDVKIGGAESWGDATRRAMSALHGQLAHHGPGDELAIFSHGGVITSIFIQLTGAHARRPQPLGHMVNTAISTARFDDSSPIIERYNDANHVPETAPWRRKMFGPEDTLIGLLVATPESDAARWVANRGVFDEVNAIIVADPSLYGIATVLSDKLGIPIDESVTDAGFENIALHHPARRVIVVSPEINANHEVREATHRVIPGARFGSLAEGTLTHIARTKSTILLADYGTILADP